MRSLDLRELNEHTPPAAVAALIEPVPAGRDGTPFEVAFPRWPSRRLAGCRCARERRAGDALVDPADRAGARASGLEGQRFRFLGYLPARPAERREKLAAIERESARQGETQVFIETPYRNDALLADILATCRAETRLSVAAELTSPREWIRTESVEGWRARPAAIGKRAAIFLLLGRAGRGG